MKNANAKLVLSALVAANATSDELVTQTGLIKPVINGNVGYLKKNGFIVADDNKVLSITDAGKAHLEEISKEVEAVTNKAPSMASKAKELFDQMYGKVERKDVIKAFMDQIGLTKAGAQTYYFNFTKAAKAAATPAANPQ